MGMEFKTPPERAAPRAHKRRGDVSSPTHLVVRRSTPLLPVHPLRMSPAPLFVVAVNTAVIPVRSVAMHLILILITM